MFPNRSPKLTARLRACGTVHSPAGFAVTPPRCIRRVPCSINTRACSSPEKHGVHVQEIRCDDPGGLGVQELPPARARAARCRIDARSMQDLPHCGRRDCHAGLHELAVDPAVSPQRILLRQADDKTGDARNYRRASWLAPLARVICLRDHPAAPGQQRRGRHREDFSPAPARDEPRQRGEPGPVSRLIPYPAGRPSQDRVLVPEHQQFSILRQVTAAHQDGQAEHPARKQVHDLEQHPPTQPSPRLARWRTRRSAMQSSIRAAKDPVPLISFFKRNHVRPWQGEPRSSRC